MTGLALVEGEANEGEGGNGLAHVINSIVDHAINLNVRRRGVTKPTRRLVCVCVRNAPRPRRSRSRTTNT